MTKLLWIGIAGGVGSILRYTVAGVSGPGGENADRVLSVGTVVVNLVGSPLIGFLWIALPSRVAAEWRIAVLVGLLGGFTTYSTFSLETVQLLNDRQWGLALLYVALTNVGAIAAAAIGLHRSSGVRRWHVIQEIPARRLRIYVNEGDRWHGHLAYEWIVREALGAGMAGATVLRGPMGFGGHHALHTSKILRLAEDLPTVVEIIDSTDRIAPFAERIAAEAGNSLITVDDVTILRTTAASEAD